MSETILKEIKKNLSKQNINEPVDKKLLDMITVSLGPSIYTRPKVNLTDELEVNRVKNNFLFRKCGVAQSTSNTIKYNKFIEELKQDTPIVFRTVLYYLLVKYFKKERMFINPISSQSPIDKGTIKQKEINEYKLVDGQIYLDTNDSNKINRIYADFISLAKAFGFELSKQDKPIKGSWYRKMVFKLKILFSSKEVKEKLDELEQALEKKYLDIPQSEITLKKSEAVSKLLTSIKDVENFAARIEDLLIVKSTNDQGKSKVAVISLSRRDLEILKNNPKLFYNPQKLLQTFSNLQNRLNKST